MLLHRETLKGEVLVKLLPEEIDFEGEGDTAKDCCLLTYFLATISMAHPFDSVLLLFFFDASNSCCLLAPRC